MLNGIFSLNVLRQQRDSKKAGVQIEQFILDFVEAEVRKLTINQVDM